MSIFDYSELIDDEGKRCMVIDMLPETVCCFDCVYCPCGRTKYKTLNPVDFGQDRSPAIRAELEAKLKEYKPDIALIESKGEAFMNTACEYVIDVIHEFGTNVRFLTTGYPLHMTEYRRICNKCDEVVGELRVTSDEDLQKFQRPLEGIDFRTYMMNMYEFNMQYPGRFILEATILKGVNDKPEDWDKLSLLIKMIKPDHVSVKQFYEPDHIYKAFGISEDVLKQAKAYLKID